MNKFTFRITKVVTVEVKANTEEEALKRARVLSWLASDDNATVERLKVEAVDENA